LKKLRDNCGLKIQTIRIIVCFILCFIRIYSTQGNGNPPSCVSCCCGNPVELGIPNGNFEDAPISPTSGWIDFIAGDMYSNWLVTSGTVSLHGPLHNNLGLGNPNGASQHMDLNGSTNGSISTPLSGLTPGNVYTIVLWYAKHNGTASATINMKVEGGQWLDETWTATNTGSSSWLQKCVSFTAQATSTTLEFIGSSPVPCCGALIDDLTMFCCTPDTQAPVFSTTPDPIINVQCPKDIPKAQKLTATDLCDMNPVVNFTEQKQGTKCDQTITRIWTAGDKCMNTATLEQVIIVEDTQAPQLTNAPTDKMVSCDQNVLVEFYNWLNNHGGATATENCSSVIWSADYLKEPTEPCDIVNTTFIASDSCGNQVTAQAKFTVVDLKSPVFTKIPTTPVLSCFSTPYDSLQSWISKHGESLASDNCGTVKWTNDFDGDLSKTNYTITFYATDFCGNESSQTATFTINKSSIISNIYKQTCDITLAGTDTVIIMKGNCDSLIITTTKYVKPDTLLITFYTCIQSQASIDTTKLLNVNGCDSLIIKKINYVKPDTIFQTIKVCGLLNEYNDTLKYMGKFCDSLVIKQFKKLPTNSFTLDLTTCDSTKAGTLVLNLMNQYGCDSIITINTKYTSYSVTNLTQHICGAGSNYLDTISYTTPECDSVVITKYIYHSLDTIYSNGYTCLNNQAGIFKTVFKNIWGCDSTHIQTIILYPSDTTYLYKETCDKLQVGISKTLSKNQYNCDSLIFTNTIYVASDTTYLTANTCDPANAGITVEEFADTPCDSVVITNTILIPPYKFITQKTTCVIDQLGFDTIKLQSSLGCDSIIITEFQYIGFEAELDVKPESCIGFGDGSISIQNIINGSPPYEFSIDSINWFVNPNFNNLVPGNFDIYIRDMNGCKAELKGIQVNSGENFKISLGPDIKVNEGSEVILNLSYSLLPAGITWQPSTLITCGYCFSPVFNPLEDTKIYVLGQSSSGCLASDSLLIKVLPRINLYIPNAFSPDLDGINDRWIIYGNYHVTNIKELKIYDRWGANVFEGSDILPGDATRGWDGKFNGKFMDPAVFVFWANVEYDNGESEIVKGEINLVR
jgi:gliding motility-associated-like protein